VAKSVNLQDTVALERMTLQLLQLVCFGSGATPARPVETASTPAAFSLPTIRIPEDIWKKSGAERHG
jgi:hypothetical protein